MWLQTPPKPRPPAMPWSFPEESSAIAHMYMCVYILACSFLQTTLTPAWTVLHMGTYTCRLVLPTTYTNLALDDPYRVYIFFMCARSCTHAPTHAHTHTHTHMHTHTISQITLWRIKMPLLCCKMSSLPQKPATLVRFRIHVYIFKS